MGERTSILKIGILVASLFFPASAISSMSLSATNANAEVEVAPAPPSIGADIPLTYFGPPPSEFQKELIGPHKLLRAGTVDVNNGTVTLPLYKGILKDAETNMTKNVWFILTDTDDKGNAGALGLNYSPKLTYANVGNAVREAKLLPDGTLQFAKGSVDFGPELKLVPGEEPNAFPPKEFQAGSIGDEHYSPLIVVKNAGGFVYNAPVVAFGVDESQISFCEGNVDHKIVHDRVVKICPEKGTVTIELVPAFSFARPVLYMTTDANNPMASAMEKVTYAPGMQDVSVGRDDSAFSAVERIFIMANGPTGTDNPQRQGLNSALMGEGSPLNVLGGIPTIATDYSPLWDANVGFWTQEALSKNYDSRVTEEFQILGLVEKGWITGPDGQPYGSTGIIINCPIVYRFL
jgi:hypothetical protein